jgi:hypothetical protein
VVFTQALGLLSQLSLLAEHSFTSAQPLEPTPLPLYPLGQSQWKLPVLFTHALGLLSQLSVLAVHSLTSLQPDAPLPLPLYPFGHLHSQVVVVVLTA